MADEPSLPYCPIPPVMKIYYQWNSEGFYTFHVCGADQRDRLFAVKVHSGYSMSAPLHVNQGIYLYNGPTTKFPLLAAAGDDFPLLSSLPVNNNSQIWIPARKSNGLVTETMRAYLTQDKHAAFRFSTEIMSSKRMNRQPFEWRNINRSERGEDNTEHGGFRLFLLTELDQNTPSGKGGSGRNSSDQGESGSSQSTSTSSAAASKDEVVAILEWKSFWTSPKHPFDLKLVGRGLSFGERWNTTVIITALRLWELHGRGKSQRGSVALAEMVGPKEKLAK
ncbi:hypothetical protein F5B22DRAFT_651440 [Xylaria bambusicola]|uniref:uncharacterized protein n=1 Tax=Xylaria bambusicola TaxID=326684 RepID=UPI002008A3CD|nr:uncharacterized protein F5B22DRAFT_651440 [Xylaria bambusicola]KAI0505762.1 hypothetical protein F5B22DRAFT_651440 [Xylaria bambusicola]